MTAIIAYVIERFPARVFVPAIALHAAVAWWAAGVERLPLRTFGTALALIALLFVLFRLWDDLEDADRDRSSHPDRVLVRSRRQPFRMLLIVLIVFCTATFVTEPFVLLGFGILCAVSWVAYRVLRPQLADPVWRYGFLLTKYPAFVGLVAFSVGQPSSARLITATAAAYVGAALYESWHHHFRHRVGVMS